MGYCRCVKGIILAVKFRFTLNTSEFYMRCLLTHHEYFAIMPESDLHSNSIFRSAPLAKRSDLASQSILNSALNTVDELADPVQSFFEILASRPISNPHVPSEKELVTRDD